MKATAKKRRKLLPAIAMLTVSAIMLSTATYAWFTMNKNATVTNMELTATTPSSIEISLGKVVNDAWAAPEEGDGADVWANTVDFASIYKATGLLKPSSSVTGLDGSFFAATNAVTAGTSDAFAAITGNPLDAAKSVVAVDDVSTLAKGYYIDIPVYFRTRGTLDATLTLESANSTIKNVNNATGVDISPAIRVAFIDEEGTTAKLWNPNTGAYFNTGAVEADTPTFKTPSWMKLTTLETDGSVKPENTGDTVVELPGSADSQKPGAIKQITLRIWIEGQDTECLNENAGAHFVGNFNFFNIKATND